MEKSLKIFQTPISEELIRIMTDQPIVLSQGSSIFPLLTTGGAPRKYKIDSQYVSMISNNYALLIKIMINLLLFVTLQRV